MKILQVISYGYLAGGAEKSVFLIKEQLRERGHEVMVVTSDHNSQATEERFSDREFAEIDRPGVPLAAKVAKHLWHWPAYRAIRSAVAEFMPDVVHFHVMGQLSPAALYAIGVVPGVLTVHGPEEYARGIVEWGFPKHLFRGERVAISNLTALGKAYYMYFCHVQRPLYIRGFRRHIKALIAPSSYMAAVLAKEGYGVPVRHIYNGIDLPVKQPLRGHNRLLYVGRLEHVKGVEVLLRAMVKVVRDVPDVHLSIVGDGAARAGLKAFVTQHKLKKQVTFHGWLDNAAVSEQYAKATAVVIPSIWPENLPTVCIEALATGRPVIGTNSGGIPELIQDGVTGRIVAKGDADALAKAIVDVLSQPDLPAMARACAASMQAFKIAAFVQNLEQLYRQIVDAADAKEIA